MSSTNLSTALSSVVYSHSVSIQLRAVHKFIIMEVQPQVQSILSSRDVSTKDALQILKKFLNVQKTFFKEHEKDTMIVDEEEEYYDDRTENKLGFDEFNQRIGGVIDSLGDDYFRIKFEENAEEVAQLPKNDKIDSTSPVDEEAENEHPKEAEQEPKIKLDESREDNDDASTSAEETKVVKDESRSRIKESKKDKKDKKKAMKKEAKKEAKRALKKAEKETKKAEKEKQKMLKKERKDKRKREKDEQTPTKRPKAE